MAKPNEDSMLFPQKLMDILSDPANQKAICWLPDGTSFAIRDRTLFSEMVMPKYFPRKAKYSSFTRKLNRWNFMRAANGPEHGVYFHKYFLRDKPHLAAQMFCKNARTMLAMKSKDADVAAEAIKLNKQTTNTKGGVVVKSKDFPIQSATMHRNPSFTSSLPNTQWSMKTNQASSVEAAKFSAIQAPTSDYKGTANMQNMDRTASFLNQQKEQLNRMLIERTLSIQQQRSNVVMQQDRLLQMRRMVEMNMLQQRRLQLQQHKMMLFQQQQRQLQTQRNASSKADGTASRVVSSNRASAA